VLRRAAALAAVAAGCVLVLVLLVRGPAYEVGMTVSNASQLVKGDQVKVGGVPVGKVSSIGLADDGRAHLVLSLRDNALTPLHVGTTAIIRSTSLAGIANRYVAIFPGPNTPPRSPTAASCPPTTRRRRSTSTRS
jgi:phospholipid/cholesterol/gamma-HCH transport system substrate-binding protein